VVNSVVDLMGEQNWMSAHNPIYVGSLHIVGPYHVTTA
jgi:hypothetical protein